MISRAARNRAHGVCVKESTYALVNRSLAPCTLRSHTGGLYTSSIIEHRNVPSLLTGTTSDKDVMVS